MCVLCAFSSATIFVNCFFSRFDAGVSKLFVHILVCFFVPDRVDFLNAYVLLLRNTNNLTNFVVSLRCAFSNGAEVVVNFVWRMNATTMWILIMTTTMTITKRANKWISTSTSDTNNNLILMKIASAVCGRNTTKQFRKMCSQDLHTHTIFTLLAPNVHDVLICLSISATQSNFGLARKVVGVRSWTKQKRTFIGHLTQSKKRETTWITNPFANWNTVCALQYSRWIFSLEKKREEKSIAQKWNGRTKMFCRPCSTSTLPFWLLITVKR